jgi:tetrahydromethanopterin S-methyltransferase subunit B
MVLIFLSRSILSQHGLILEMEPINNEIEKKENKNEDLKKNKSNSSLPISNSSQKVLPASLSCRDIKQTANIQDTSPNDNDAFSKRESVSAEPKNAFEKKIIDMINSLIELYYEKISYKRESVIILLLLLPLPLLAVSFPLLDKLVFTNSTYGFGFKIITIFVGLIAIYGIDIINKRHAQLSHIVKIINGEGTIRSICDSIKGKGKNRPLAWTGIHKIMKHISFMHA